MEHRPQSHRINRFVQKLIAIRTRRLCRLGIGVAADEKGVNSSAECAADLLNGFDTRFPIC